MLDPAPLLQGTWSEVLRHQEEIPATQRVKVVPIESFESATDETLADNLNDLLEEAENLFPGEPILFNDPHKSAFAEGLREKFGEMGFKR
jgi:hypothetical protein